MLTDLVVEWVGAELHWAGDDGLGGDGVEDVAVLEEDEAGHVRDDVPPLELLQVHYLQMKGTTIAILTQPTPCPKRIKLRSVYDRKRHVPVCLAARGPAQSWSTPSRRPRSTPASWTHVWRQSK